MARVTVEDCLENVDNRFELVLVASKRARQLAREYVDPMVPADGDKPTVIALREIAQNFIDKNILDKQQAPAKVAEEEDVSGITAEIIAETQQTEEEFSSEAAEEGEAFAAEDEETDAEFEQQEGENAADTEDEGKE